MTFKEVDCDVWWGFFFFNNITISKDNTLFIVLYQSLRYIYTILEVKYTRFWEYTSIIQINLRYSEAEKDSPVNSMCFSEAW